MTTPLRVVWGALTAFATLCAVAVPMSVVNADGCGADGSTVCPSVDSVLPRGWETVTAPVSVSITGVSLTYASRVTLQPVGRSLHITARSDTSLTVTVPGNLPVGAYSLHIAFGGALSGVTADSPRFYVASFQPVAAAPASFAPNPSLVTPAPVHAVATQSVEPAKPASHGFLFFLGGLVGGGVLLLPIALRAGILPMRGGERGQRTGTEPSYRPAPASGDDRPAEREPRPQGGAGWSVRSQSKPLEN